MSEASSSFRYEDLFDIENRPGAGVRLWGEAVKDQIERVVDAANRHRQNHVPEGMEVPEDERLDPNPNAERRLHIEVYFLALAIRRVLLFHEAIAGQIEDPRLDAARKEFLSVAPQAKDFRDFFEHLDEYLLGQGNAQKNGRILGRMSPILLLRWDCANVVVSFGDETLDITNAGEAAVELATATGKVWEEYRERAIPPSRSSEENGEADQVLEVTTSQSTVIGGEDEGHRVTTGILLGVRVRPASTNGSDTDS